MLTGDTLFADSIGRCDLWGGNEAAIRESLAKLRTLDKNLEIYPGHGAPSRLGDALDNAAYYL
jgi:glyoxylase-like metal-dependent hydrolase (beta-lactamase superfamily II)